MRREKMNNKGFSLVELIIVIAIMAILSAALAPQLMKYIEKSRTSTDSSSCTSIESCVNAALAEENIYKEVAAAGGSTGVVVNISFPSDALTIAATPACADLEAELTKTLGTLKAPKQTGKTHYVVEIQTHQDATAGTTEVGKIKCYTKNGAVASVTY